MKTLKLILVAGFALASPLATRAELSARAWLETYYLAPQPEALPAAIRSLSHDGYFNETGHIALGIGFVSAVFTQHPDRVDQWLTELNGLPLQEQRLIACALWQAGHPLGVETLEHLSEFARNRTDVARLTSAPVIATDDTPVLSESSMNFRWGAFLATGDKNHIVAILDGIGNHEPGLTATVQRALAHNAAAHPRVLDICRDELARQPDAITGEFRAAVLPSTPARPRS